jgi:glucose-6-phosphate 1-epimerase
MDIAADLARLNDEFGIEGVLLFDEHEGLTRASVTTTAASATIYLHGAHLTHWQPTGEEPVLFTSAKSAFQTSKAIRGGVPVIFPCLAIGTMDRRVRRMGSRVRRSGSSGLRRWWAMSCT